MNQITPFSGTGSTDVETWIDNWTSTMEATGFNDQQQKSHLQAKLKEPALTWYRQLPAMNNGVAWTIAALLERIREQYTPPNALLSATIKLRHTFQNSMTVDEYAAEFQKIVHRVDPHMNEQSKVNTFVAGLNLNISNMMIGRPDPATLQEAIATARSIEDRLKLARPTGTNMINNIDEVINEKLTTLTLAVTKLQELGTKSQINAVDATDNKDPPTKVGGHTPGATCMYCGKLNHLATQCTLRDGDAKLRKRGDYSGTDRRRDNY